MSTSVLMEEVSPSKAEVAHAYSRCSQGGASQLHWFEVGLVVVG